MNIRKYIRYRIHSLSIKLNLYNVHQNRKKTYNILVTNYFRLKLNLFKYFYYKIKVGKYA